MHQVQKSLWCRNIAMHYCNALSNSVIIASPGRIRTAKTWVKCQEIVSRNIIGCHFVTSYSIILYNMTLPCTLIILLLAGKSITIIGYLPVLLRPWPTESIYTAQTVETILSKSGDSYAIFKMLLLGLKDVHAEVRTNIRARKEGNQWQQVWICDW